jgi:hypothetical protein
MNIEVIPKCLINLPERTIKLIDSEKEINSFFDNKAYKLIEGVKEDVSYKGIAQAHMNCISYAKENNFDNVLIMEDDIAFRSNAKQYAINAFNDVPSDYDLLLGGLYNSEKLTPYNEYWNKTSEFAGLHFYVVNKKAYDKILSFKKNGHIDRYMCKANLKCYVTKKFFATQRAGFSDNVGQFKDYSYLLDKFDLL